MGRLKKKKKSRDEFSNSPPQILVLFKATAVSGEIVSISIDVNFQQILKKITENCYDEFTQTAASSLKYKHGLYFKEERSFLITGKTIKCMSQFSSLQSLSCIRLFVTPWTAVCQASLSITNSQSLLKLMSIESVRHPTISSSVIPFFSCHQSCPASGSFPMSQFFASGGQSIGVSASTSLESFQ